MTLLEVIDAIIDRMLLRPQMFAENWTTYDALLMHYFEMRDLARHLPPEALKLQPIEARAIRDGLVVTSPHGYGNRVREYLEQMNQGNLHDSRMKIYQRFRHSFARTEEHVENQESILAEYRKLTAYVRDTKAAPTPGDEDDAVLIDFVASRLGVDAAEVLVTDTLVCIEKGKLR